MKCSCTASPWSGKQGIFRNVGEPFSQWTASEFRLSVRVLYTWLSVSILTSRESCQCSCVVLSVLVLVANCSGSVNRTATVAKQMTVLLVESSAGITAVKARMGRRNICEIKLELVGAVKLAGAPKAGDSVKGQIYNKAKLETTFRLDYSLHLFRYPPSLSLSLSHGQ